MHINCLRGRVGMLALLRAFRDAGREFELTAMVAVPAARPELDYHMLFTIGETTAAMTIGEAQWFAERLMNDFDALGGPIADDIGRFGQMIQSVIAEAPGPHGVH